MWAVSKCSLCKLAMTNNITPLPPLYTQLTTEYRWCWDDKDGMAGDREVGV